MEANNTTESSKTTFITIVVLIVFAILAVSSRIWMQQVDDLPSGDSAWTIKITQQITASEKGATLSISPPWDTRYARMFAQSLSHTGLRQNRVKSSENKRDIVLVASKAGNYTVEAIFSIHVSSLAHSEPKKSKLSELNRSQWLLSESHGIQINSAATTEIVESISKTTTSSDELIEKLFGYVSNNVRIKRRTNNNSETVLLKGRATSLGSNRALVALLRTAHLPARIVTGVNLQSEAEQQPYSGLKYMTMKRGSH